LPEIAVIFAERSSCRGCADRAAVRASSSDIAAVAASAGDAGFAGFDTVILGITTHHGCNSINPTGGIGRFGPMGCEGPNGGPQKCDNVNSAGQRLAD
jgi:hypothetical protein